MIWAVTSRNSHWHVTMYLKHSLLVHRSHDVFWQACISVRQSVLASGRFWRGHLMKTSTKRVFVGQKCPNHGTRVEWEYKSSISWTYLRSGDSEKQAFSPFWCGSSYLFSTTCCLGKRDSAARDVIWIVRRNSIIIRGNASENHMSRQR